MQDSRRGRARFQDFDIDLDAGELYKSGTKIHLQRQPFEVLTLLIEHPGEVVTREEIRDRIWGAGTFGDFDQNLNRAIRKIRSALEDSAEEPNSSER